MKLTAFFSGNPIFGEGTITLDCELSDKVLREDKGANRERIVTSFKGIVFGIVGRETVNKITFELNI